jgi:hypothetical protein
MKIPSLHELQRRFPLGNLELDDIARRQLNAVVNFRNLFAEPIELFSKQSTTDELNERIDVYYRERGQRENTQEAHNRIIFGMIADMMEEEDTTLPAQDVLIADCNFEAERMASTTAEQRLGPAMSALRAIAGQLGGSGNIVSFGVMQCSVRAAFHYIFRYVIGSMLYRRSPDIRVPIHRLIEYNVDVPDGSTTPQVIITGYDTKLILSLGQNRVDEVPDTIPEDFLRDGDDEG